MIIMYLNFKSKYDRFPKTNISGQSDQVFVGYNEILNNVKSSLEQKKVIVLEFYPGVNILEVENELKKLDNCKLYGIEKYAKENTEIEKMLKDNLTDDRVFGYMYKYNIEDYYDETKLEVLRKEISVSDKPCIIYGTGASLVNNFDCLYYFDLARWEIQLRYRAGMSNFLVSNPNEDILRKFKRGYFIEWRVADRLKKRLFNKIDYWVDTNKSNNPKMITHKAFNIALNTIAHKPFRLVPYFDPGVWGGQWMKEVCNLPLDKDNYAWSFDGVPEENSLYFDFGKAVLEFPAIDLVFFRPHELLGEKVHGRFGAEFPIRFDFLDTMNGQNLSLQVHPLTEYIQEKFGMHYTQDESYYILDAEDDAVVYLGVKEGVKPEELIYDLEEAQKGSCSFPDEKYINKFPAKKHDHFLIPAGTIHCSGRNAMVLEISATPYIFTFKLWDWDRLGLDGKPRPVHIEHGKHVIQYDRDTNWVKKNLINNFTVISENEIKTGLHEREFIETHRLTFDSPIVVNNHGSVNMCNLVDGEEAIIESCDNSFEPFVVHYAETFVIPESVKSYTIKSNCNKKCSIIQAYVR